jgi:hypothetical protein
VLCRVRSWKREQALCLLKRPRSECEEHLQEAAEDWQEDCQRLQEDRQRLQEAEVGKMKIVYLLPSTSISTFDTTCRRHSFLLKKRVGSCGYCLLP